MKLLQERGLISLKNGSGAYITRPETDTVMNAINRIMQVDHIKSEDLTQVREILELSSADLAVQKITDEDLQKMDEILSKFEDKTLPLKERVKLDEQFHLTIAQAGGNELLCMFIGVLTSLLRDYMGGKGILVEGGIEDAISRHREIYQPSAIEIGKLCIMQWQSTSRYPVLMYSSLTRKVQLLKRSNALKNLFL